jgi:hypothetical protein
MALLSPCVIFYIFSYSKKEALKTALIIGALLGLFIIYSFHEFSQYLPDYYLPKRLDGGCFSKALYGHIASPSRGLLIYSSFLAVLFMGLLFNNNNIRLKKSWLLVGLLWPLLHLLTLSRFPDWWSGWSYGPRYMTDVLPGIFLLCIHAWPISSNSLASRAYIILLAISILISVCIHTGQGLFNRSVFVWNTNPNIDTCPDRIFDWRDPQFLALPKNNE